MNIAAHACDKLSFLPTAPFMHLKKPCALSLQKAYRDLIPETAYYAHHALAIRLYTQASNPAIQMCDGPGFLNDRPSNTSALRILMFWIHKATVGVCQQYCYTELHWLYGAAVICLSCPSLHYAGPRTMGPHATALLANWLIRPCRRVERRHCSERFYWCSIAPTNTEIPLNVYGGFSKLTRQYDCISNGAWLWTLIESAEKFWTKYDK